MSQSSPKPPQDKSPKKRASDSPTDHANDSASLPRSAYYPAATAAAMFVLTLFFIIRGGIEADMTGVDPSQINQAHQLFFARYIGVLAIVLGSVLPLAIMAGGAIGLGAVLRKFLGSQVSLLIYATAGLGLLWLGFEGLALLGAANTIAAWSICVLAIVAGLLCHLKQLRSALGQSQSISLLPLLNWRWSSVLVACPLALLVAAACCPPGTLWSVEAFGYDVLSYHLQIPREWLHAGQMTGLEHNVYSYLPSLVEVAFLQLGAMQHRMFSAVYTCQLLNVCLCALAAAHLAKLIHTLTPGKYASVCAWFAAAIFLATPWVLVTGSMAYDEAAVLAFGAAALSLTLDPTLHGNGAQRRWTAAILTGVLVGLATQAKLTSGFMIAIPMGLVWLLGLTSTNTTKAEQGQTSTGKSRTRQLLQLVVILTAAGSLMLGPYLLRNAVWTGNPVFPFATSTLGKSHWNDQLVSRWQRGHHVSESIGERLTALGQQWVFNTGYGSIGGRARSVDPTKPEARNVAYFPKQWGMPTLLLVALTGWIVLMLELQPGRRKLAMALGVMVLAQVLAWLFLTHLQSRFMIFSLLPVCVLASAGLGSVAYRWLVHVHVAVHGVCVLLVGVLVITAGGLLRQQTIGRLPLWQLMDTLPTREQALDPLFNNAIVGDHPINKLPAYSKTLLVADNSRLFYIQRPIVYHSAFDASVLGEIIRKHPDNPVAVTAALKAMGITHIWLHGPELERLMTTYGYDPDVNPKTLQSLIATGWRKVHYQGVRSGVDSQGRPLPLVDQVSLYALP